MKKILPFFSYLFHPLFIPLFTVVYFFYKDENYLVTAEKLLIAIQIIIITILIPIAFFFLLRSMGKIDSVMASDLKQRRWPLVLQGVLLYILLRQSIAFDRIPELYFFFLSILMTTVLALVFLFAKIKMSLHMAAMAAMLFFIVGLSIHSHSNDIAVIALLLVMTGLVASSRLEMKAHTYTELGIGFAAGMLPQVAFWYFWL